MAFVFMARFYARISRDGLAELLLYHDYQETQYEVDFLLVWHPLPLAKPLQLQLVLLRAPCSAKVLNHPSQPELDT